MPARIVLLFTPSPPRLLVGAPACESPAALLSVVSIPVMMCRDHPDDPEYSLHLKTLHVIISAEFFSPHN